jgi:hypothetical protein
MIGEILRADHWLGLSGLSEVAVIGEGEGVVRYVVVDAPAE